MTRVIRGFAPNTGYMCSQCHLKCCASEYKLPILELEKKVLQKQYPFTKIFIQSTLDHNILLRGDSCPFLDSKGLCILHNTPNKPLICQTYPLVFWKVSPSLILVWLNPCRGDGFQWVAKPENQITNSSIDYLISKIENNFKNYWGEFIDKENPFIDISNERIDQELSFFKSYSKNKSSNEIISFMRDETDFKNVTKIIDPLLKSLNEYTPHKELNSILNAVLHWIRWSPVGLQLTLLNSITIFTTASLWIDLRGREVLSSENLPINHERYLRQLGSFLATAILPTFWQQVQNYSIYKNLKRFSEAVKNILEGKLPQNALLNSIT